MSARERAATAAELAGHAARMERARPATAVRRGVCQVCGARRYGPCQVTPPADHLGRWLDAYAQGRITKADLIGAVGGVTIVTHRELVAA